MQFDSFKRPVRIDGAEDAPVRWFFRNHFIEVIHFENYYWVRVRPSDRGRPLQMEKIFWPVRKYQDRQETIKHINRLLNAACASVEQNTFQHSTSKPYTTDGPLVAFLQSVKHKQFRIKMLENDLIGLHQIKQLSFSL